MGELYRPEKIQGAMSSLGRTGVCIPRHATRASHHARADVALGANRRSVWRDDGRPPDERGALAVLTTVAFPIGLNGWDTSTGARHLYTGLEET